MLQDVTKLALTCLGWPNGEKLALACVDLDQSERKSTQLHARPGQTESKVDPSFQLASTCDSVWPGFKDYTTSDIEKFSQNCTAIRRVQCERILRVVSFKKLLELPCDYSFILWLRKYGFQVLKLFPRKNTLCYQIFFKFLFVVVSNNAVVRNVR